MTNVSRHQYLVNSVIMSVCLSVCLWLSAARWTDSGEFGCRVRCCLSIYTLGGNIYISFENVRSTWNASICRLVRCLLDINTTALKRVSCDDCNVHRNLQAHRHQFYASRKSTTL